MKSLNIVQTIAKVMKILSLVVLILTIVGTAFVLLAAFLLMILPDMFDMAEAREIMDSVMSEFPYNFEDMGIAMIGAAIIMAGSCVTTGFTYAYFKNEMIDGTPFTHRGEKELRRLGILYLAIPCGTSLAASVIVAISGLTDTFNTEVGIGLGIALILLSFVVRYGTELREQSQKAEEESDITIQL